MLPHFLALYQLSIRLKVLMDQGFWVVQQALIMGIQPDMILLILRGFF
ncbi:MAG: hypothetical protein RIE73_22560 [Coleofasciculus sp. C1-SOL-03]